MSLAGKPGGFVVDHFINDEDSSIELTPCDLNINAVVEYLKSEGFHPEITGSYRVHFKFEGHPVYFNANPDDDQQFTLFIPNVCHLEASDRDLAIKTAHYVGSRLLGVKVVVLANNQVWVVHEAIAADIPAFTSILNNVAERLLYGTRDFIDVFQQSKLSKTLN